METNVKNHTKCLKKRVWEIDAIRGLLFFFLLLFHLYFTLDAFVVDGIYKNVDIAKFLSIADPLGILWADKGSGYERCFLGKYFDAVNTGGVSLFFVISGISCIFSRNNLKSGIRLMIGAAFVSLFTWLLGIYTGDKYQFIRFGALHCYAVCHLIYYFLLENRKDKLLLLVAGLSLLIGYYLKFNPISTRSALLVPFGFYEKNINLRDYWPVFPMLGWFLIGVVMGRHWYMDKKTRFPNLENKKWHRPLRFLGRHSGLIYCGHMVVYSIVFIGIGHIFDLY